MKKMTKYSILSFASFIILGCASIKENNSESFKATNPLIIVQGDNRIEIKNCDTIIDINKKPFSLEFICRKYDGENKLFYSTRIAATHDNEEFQKVKNGPLEEDHSFFGFATGKSASSDEEYETMYIDNNGHHYIYYSSEIDKRATLLKDMNDETVNLRWTINTFTIDGKARAVDSTNLEHLYMLYYQDLNLNDTIESGELIKIQLNLK